MSVIGNPVAEFQTVIRSRLARREAAWGVVFALPWISGFLIFMAYPIIFSIILSFCKWDPYSTVDQASWIGLDNYRQAFADPLMWKSLYNTFFYAIFAVPIALFGSLFLAMLLNTNVPGIRFFRTIFYLPSVVSGVATAILWIYIFNPTFGPLNSLIRSVNDLFDLIGSGGALLAWVAAINLPEPAWLDDPDWAKPAIILMQLWGTGGASMLIFLAGLQGIPDHLYEAADLDGAGRMRKMWNITVPMLTPTIFFNLIMGMIGALKVFMQAYVMAGEDGGVDNALLFYVLYIYKKGFIEFEMGYASALAWILFAITMTMTLLVVRSSAVWVYYEGEKR